MHVNWHEAGADLRLVAFTGIGTEVFSKFVRHVHEGIGIWGRRLFPRDVGPNGRVFDRAYGKAPMFGTSDTQAFKRAIDMTDDELAAIVVRAKLKVV